MHQYLLLLVSALFVVANSATLPLQTFDIPVIVVYDDYYEGAKIRRSPGVYDAEYNGNGVRNLDAKVQLSQEELAEAAKYFRVVDSNSNAIEDHPESPKPDESTYQALGESSTLASSTTLREESQNPNYVLLVQVAQAIVSSGLNNIRETIDNLSANEQGENKNPPISSAQWDRLNKTITDLFSSLLQPTLFKSSDRNVVAEIVSGFKGATDDFVLNLRSETATQKPQNAAPSQNIISIVTSGFQQIASNLGSISFRSTTQTTVLGDAPAPTAAPFAPLQGIINGIQQFFVGPTTKPPSSGNLYATSAPGSVGQGVQNLVDQVGQGIPNPVGGSQGSNTIQQGISNIVNQVASLNPLNPGSSTPPPGTPSSGAPSNGPLQQVQNFLTNPGQVINNFLQGPNAQHEGQQNPQGPIQQIIYNVQHAVSSVFNPSTPPPSAQHEGQTTQGPIQSVVQNVQNFGNQVLTNLNPFNRPAGGTAAPGVQLEGSTTAAPGPIQQVFQGFQNIANQIGTALTGGGTTKPPSGSLAPGQGLPGQISQAVSALNPGSLSSTPSPQLIVSQIGDAINALNPIKPGESKPPLDQVTDIPGAVQEIASQVGGLIDPANIPQNAITEI